jgi:predicted Fe-Mo cluster-binding NifX family protein
MKKPSSPRARAIGAIGPGAVKRLEEAGLMVVSKAEYEELERKLKALEQDSKRLLEGMRQ